MIRAGFTFEHPITHNRTTVLPTEAETTGTGWLLEYHVLPQTGPIVPEHVHLTWTETFEIILIVDPLSSTHDRPVFSGSRSFQALEKLDTEFEMNWAASARQGPGSWGSWS